MLQNREVATYLASGLFAALVALAAIIVIPFAGYASGLDEGTHQLSNIDIHYIEARPNSGGDDAQRDRMRRIYRQFDQAAAGQDERAKKQAEKLALENGYLDIPHPLYDALIQQLSNYNVSAYPTFYSSVRSSEQAEKLRRQLAGKYHYHAGNADYVLSLLPYQATLKDKNHSVVWIGVWLRNRRTNTSNIYYVTVPFDKGRHHGFDRNDGKRLAATLVSWLVEQGVLTPKE